ncbi:MAG: hypothetical protein ABSH25_06825 [Syntrophorhabdales bacterium]|jgi:hypothetical protein
MRKPSARAGRKGLSSWLIALAALLLICCSAGADTYDDFKEVGIDVDKWQVNGDGFSQPGDGLLHFSAVGPTLGLLASKTFFVSGVFTMSFLDYSSDNQAPPNKRLGSIVGLGLGTRENWVRIERGQVGDGPRGQGGGYVEVNWIVPSEAGSPIHLNWSPSKIAAGYLQIRYDGVRVSFFYRASPSDAWTQIGKTSLTPGWREAVPILVFAAPGGTKSDRYSLSFKLGNIDVTAVPDLKE